MKPPLQPMIASLAACVALAQQGAGPLSQDPPDEEDVPESDEEWDFSKRRGLHPEMLERLNRLVPEGREHTGLRYPIYRENGETGPGLASVFESQRLSRIDESHLQFDGAVFSSFDDEKFPDLATRVVSFSEAIYDLRLDVLFTESPVKIDDRQMSIRCGGMLHDRASGLTLFTNGVELFLHQQPKKKKPSAATPPGAASSDPSPEPATPPDARHSP